MVATVSVPIVAETCARRGAGFSRFLQLVPGEGESQTTGDERSESGCAMRNLESCDRIGLFYEDSSGATISRDPFDEVGSHGYRSTSLKGQKRCIT